MAAKINAPTTYAEICRAASEYHGSNGYPAYNRHYHAVNTAEFRNAILNGCDDHTAERLRACLAGFGCHTDDPTRDRTQRFIRQNIADIKSLSGADLIECTLDNTPIEVLFNGLFNVDGVASTSASKILALINPLLFVMWDDAIRLAYHENTTRDRGPGRVYVEFLIKMQGSAIAITKDAKTNHGIASPAEHLSGELGLKPPFTLAKFIDEYNFVHTH